MTKMRRGRTGLPLFVPLDTIRNAPQLTLKGVHVVINDCLFPEDGHTHTHTPYKLVHVLLYFIGPFVTSVIFWLIALTLTICTAPPTSL